MAASKPAQSDEKKRPRKKRDRAAEIANTFEWLITAFILAFVFRAFVMEAFRIPTGSMADTLMGAHFRLRCPECGYRYEYGFVPQNYGMRQDTVPAGPVPLRQPTRCPSCGAFTPESKTLPVANGDRILVLKCIYQFMEPKRWDVIVFKNPTDPSENYIKRLIGLPEEEIEIIDGDVYIDGLIARKPAQVQQEVWMPVYDRDFQPVNPSQRTAFNGNRWQPPFNFDTSAWQVSAANPTQIVLDVPSDQVSDLHYGAAPSANAFNITYAYNDVRSYERTPLCSDLMVRFHVEAGSAEGQIGVALTKHGVEYKATLDLAGEMILSQAINRRETVLRRKDIDAPAPGVFTLVKFACVDHQLLFEFNGNELSVDLGRTPDALPQGDANSPHAAIFGSGKLVVSHLAVFRDIYYTGDGQSSREARAVEGNPFKLNKDEFFVLGDNSPNSEDGRWWRAPHLTSKGWAPPRAGVVPRHYLVGKALFVYWPSGFEFPWPRKLKQFLLENNDRNLALRLVHGIVSLRWIPNVGQMRFIYGGTKRNSIPPGTPEPVQQAKR